MFYTKTAQSTPELEDMHIELLPFKLALWLAAKTNIIYNRSLLTYG